MTGDRRRGRERWRGAIADLLHRGTHAAERELDEAAARLRSRFGRGDPIVIRPYRGFGDDRHLWLMGRVLEDEGIPVATDGDSAWRNLLAMYLRFESDEVAGARVRATWGSTVVDAVTDEEGYFEVRLPIDATPPDSPPWRDVALEMVDAEAQAIGRVRVPHPDAEFGVISDIDDTILRSDATSLITLARSTLLSNARSRMPFEGVAAFYRALEAGPGGVIDRAINPFFYVSSSPWNLYDFIEEFFAIHRLPEGPLLLRDLGIDDEVFFRGGHGHKLAKIERVLGTYPDLPFVLIGDSGQEDPELYRQAVDRFPGRIRTIYIRHVSDDLRRDQIGMLIEEVAKHDIQMLLVADTLGAARHAAAAGLIHADRLAEIGLEKRMDEAADEV